MNRGREFIGQSFGRKNVQKVQDERADIRRTSDAIRLHARARCAAFNLLPASQAELWDLIQTACPSL